MSGATAEKASPLVSVSSPLKSGGIDVDQIVYAPPTILCWFLAIPLSPLGIVQQQPRGDFPLLRSRRPQVPIEILGGDLRQSLCPVREFPGDAEIVKGRKPVPPRNKFRTTTRIAWRTRQIYWPSLRSARSPRSALLFCAAMPSRALWAYGRKVSVVLARRTLPWSARKSARTSSPTLLTP
jgi:hypothetical protein